MQICVEDARVVNPKIKLGICGEQGGVPDSVKFCHKLGPTYVSYSPNRVLVARLVAAWVSPFFETSSLSVTMSNPGSTTRRLSRLFSA